MKILMIGPFPPAVNGVTVSNDFLYKWLISKGEKVSYINTETGLIASRQGDKISLSKIITFLSIYKHILKVLGKSVVYMAIGQTFWGLVKYSPFIVLCRLMGIPYILHIHGGYVCKAYEKMSASKKQLFKNLLQGSKTVIALSTGLSNDLKETFPKANVEVVENFYDPRLIGKSTERSKNEKTRFLFLSNLMLGKGILDFLDALRILKDKEILFEVAIAGGLEKGIHDTLQQKVNELGDSVHFFGLADFEKKKELLYWSDVFVLPTWYIMEGQPLSIIEAYVTGNVVVSTHQGGIADISGYDSFFKTEAQNVSALADSLVHVTKQLPELDNSLLVTAQAAQKRFNPENFLFKIETILKGSSKKI
ncbi:glycosyltransferase family 4 protein [Cytophaga aurantiaca]|uniref:glycosyltransferase family 4 protein n=1 Tax=Cytophaga aurantiaca TaxID=29530 RepID=UPI0012FC6DAB|nr:glycosyltransferase family 4 protein [Cytophaga aurantiaca]